MNYLPAVGLLPKDKRAATNRALGSVELKGHDGRAIQHLNLHLSRHDVEVRRPSRITLRSFKDRPKAEVDRFLPIYSL